MSGAHIDAIPAEVRAPRAWLGWRAEPHPTKLGKVRKIPYYTNGVMRSGTPGGEADRSQLATFDEACDALLTQGFDGLGLAMLPDVPLTAFDFDDCVTDGEIDPRVLDIVSGTYTEISPSGNGVRVFFNGVLPSRKKSQAEGGELRVEVFGGSGFVTVTGNAVLDPLLCQAAPVSSLTPIAATYYQARFGAPAPMGASFDRNDSALMSLQPRQGLTLDQAAELLVDLDPACAYEDWLGIGQALHHEFDGSVEALDLWDDWSSRASEGYAGRRAIEGKWSSFGRYTGRPKTMRSVMQAARERRTRSRYAARDAHLEAIRSASDDFALRERVAPAIAADVRLQEIEREELAQALMRAFAALDHALPIAAVRKLLARPRSASADAVPGRRELTEFGNADRMLDRFGKSLMFGPELDTWYVWDGARWRATTKTEIEGYAQTTVRDMVAEAPQHADRAEFLHFAKESQRARMLGAMERIASSRPEVCVPAAELDADLDLVAARNGVIDLRTGTLMPADPSMRITRTLPCDFNPTARADLFRQTLHDVFAGDHELVAFFQRLMGYCLTGRPDQDVLVIAYGSGSNGKSTVFGALREVFGDYGLQANASTFIGDAKSYTANAGGPREDLVRLKGRRFVTVTEPDEGGVLREGTVKAMSGGDPIVARVPNAKASIEFMPTWTTVMPTNHVPIIKGLDNGIWRRIVLLPFTVNFDLTPASKDEQRAEKLRAEREGILAWLVDGVRLYREQGLNIPASVRLAGTAYREQMDYLSDWLESRCEINAGASESISRLFESWRSYADPLGLMHLCSSAVALGRKLDQRFPSVKVRGVRSRAGLRVKDFGEA